MTTSQLIEQFIAENGGNTRDALNVALARLENATHIIVQHPHRPNAIEALSEALRRIYAVQTNGNCPPTRWDAYNAVRAYQQELTDACLNRISEGVDEWEEMQNDADQPTDDEVDASDAADYLAFLKQCRP